MTASPRPNSGALRIRNRARASCALRINQAIRITASSAHRSAVGPTASMLVNWLKPLTGSKIDVMTTRPELICAIG